MTATLVTLLTSLFTGASVLVAIWVYRCTEDQRTFSAFRLSLVDLRQDVHELDNLLAEPFFTEVGLAISDEVRQLFPTPPSKAELKAYVLAERNHNYIAQAIHSGRLRSATLEKCDELIVRIERSPFLYREQLPVVSHLLSSLSDYVVNTARGVASPSVFDALIGNPQRFAELAADKFDTDEVPDAEAFRFIGLMLGAVPTTFMKTKGQRIFDAAEELMIMVVSKYNGMADKELRKHGRRQRRMLKKLEQIEEAQPVTFAFECFRLIRDVFDQDRWDRIVANVTKIRQYAHGDD